MAKKSKQWAISWDTEDAEQTGLPDDLDVTFSEPVCRLASTSDYNEDDDDGVPVLSIPCTPDEGDPFTIHLSAGKADRMVPNEDGTGFVPAEDSHAKGISKSTNLYHFLKSLDDAGFPKDKLRSEGITIIDGLYCHLLRVPQPKRRGLAAADEEETSRTMPSITEIHKLPWEKGSKKKPAGKKAKAEPEPEEEEDEDEEEETAKLDKKFPKVGKKKAAPTDEDEDEDEEEEADEEEEEEADSSDYTKEAEKAILKALKEPAAAKKGIAKDDVYNAAFQKLKTHPQRKKVLALIQEDDWISDDDRPWFYNDKMERITATE